MKLLVLSDSHSSRSFMRLAVERVRPDAMVHLGDYYDDGDALHEEYPHIPIYQVAGNCDRYRCPPWASEILTTSIASVRIYMTHGHRQGVKQSLSRLIAEARQAQTALALFGHTHSAYAEQLSDGLWLLNPGSCGYFGGSVGVVEMENEKITSVKILRETELEEIP